jgi:FHA domain
MSSKRLTLKFDINAVGIRAANIRADLTVAQMIDSIRERYTLDTAIELRVDPDTRGPLPTTSPLNALTDYGVEDGATLRCVAVTHGGIAARAIRQGQRQNFSRRIRRVWMVEPRTRQVFDLTWWPAIIGRRNADDPRQNTLLAVDLTALDMDRKISRHHACVLERDDAFVLEALNSRNPLFLNDRRLQHSETRPLSAGDTIRLGSLSLQFLIQDQERR